MNTGANPARVASLSDDELVAEVKSAMPGDHRAFTELLRRHEATVHANCRYLTTPEEAEDLAQEVFIKAYFGLPRFQGRSSFKTWLTRIKANHCINHRQKSRKLDRESTSLDATEELVHSDWDDSWADRISEQRQIDEALHRMSPTLRIPLVLSDRDGFTLAEIAELLDVGLSAVKMRVMRARRAFRELYDSVEGADSDD